MLIFYIFFFCLAWSNRNISLVDQVKLDKISCFMVKMARKIDRYSCLNSLPPLYNTKLVLKEYLEMKTTTARALWTWSRRFSVFKRWNTLKYWECTNKTNIHKNNDSTRYILKLVITWEAWWTIWLCYLQLCFQLQATLPYSHPSWSLIDFFLYYR